MSVDNIQKRLIRNGWTNRDQEDFGNVQMAPRKVHRKYCTSEPCTRKYRKAQKNYELAKVPRETDGDTCPVCHHALFSRWEIE